MHLISIIIPVYKAEKYIRKCLDSIKAQTHTHWEAILVDDGSPDGSGAICDEYAASDKRFKVIHRENGGVSVARQTGLDNATGDYIIHCDPDDWVEPTMLEELLAKAIEEDADMVICDYIEENDGFCEYIKTDKQITNASILQKEIILSDFNCALWNKLISNKIAKKIKFTPCDITFAEDKLYLLKALFHNPTIRYLKKGLYHYNKHNTTSLSHNKKGIINSLEKFINAIESFPELNKFELTFNIKKQIIQLSFENKMFAKLNLFPEVHAQICNNRVYNFFTPLNYFTALSLTGYPNLAYIGYKLNIYLIEAGKAVKNYLNLL